MKKKYLAKVVMGAAILGTAGLASNASAVVNLDNGTGLSTYATEVAGQVAFNDSITAQSKVVMPVAAVPYVKFSCTAALVTATPDLGVTDTSGGAMTGPGVLVSGGIGVKSATYSSTIGGVPIAKNDVYAWGAGAGPAPVQINITTGDVVTCTYEIFETANHWSQGNAAATTSNTIVKWGQGLLTRAADTSCTGVTGCASGNYAVIDLTADGKKFTNNRTTGMVASINLNARAGDGLLNAAGGVISWTAMTDATSANTNLVVSGDFTAATKVWFELGGGTCAAYSANNAATLNADKTTASFTNKQLATAWGVNTNLFTTANNGGNVCMEVDGTTVMAESDYTAMLSLKPGAGFNVPESTDLGQVGNVDDNGSNNWLQLVLTPGGSYAGFVRVSHVGPDSGDVSFDVVNDDGTKVLVKIEDIEGQSTATLGAMASTTQISVADIYAAAQVADPTFATTGNNKLRINVKSTSTTGVNGSMYSLSKDGNSFTLIQE